MMVLQWVVPGCCGVVPAVLIAMGTMARAQAEPPVGLAETERNMEIDAQGPDEKRAFDDLETMESVESVSAPPSEAGNEVSEAAPEDPPARPYAEQHDLDFQRDPRTGLYLVAVGFDIAPWVGTSSVMLGRDSRQLSLGLVGILTGTVNGLEASGGLNIDRFDVNGFQGVGGANFVLGTVRGFQAAGGANVVMRGVHGFQAAGGLNLVVGNQSGFQGAGGGNIVTGSVDGFQGAGGANIVLGDVEGFQGAGGANISLGTVDGLQLAGGANLAGAIEGGTQIAGGVNVAVGDVDGIQVGTVNIAENADAAIGLLSIMTKGRWAMDAYGGDTGLLQVALVNGARYSHTMVHVGIHPFGRNMVFAAGFGFGGHIPVGDEWSIDIDLLASGLFKRGDGDRETHKTSLLGTLRAVARWRLTRGLGLFVGPAFNVLASESLKGGRFSLFGLDKARESRNKRSRFDPDIWVWPGFEAGLRVHLN
ncbi:hypothetical protein ACFL6C_03145 [Myxococcota bacterium]